MCCCEIDHIVKYQFILIDCEELRHSLVITLLFEQVSKSRMEISYIARLERNNISIEKARSTFNTADSNLNVWILYLKQWTHRLTLTAYLSKELYFVFSTKEKSEKGNLTTKHYQLLCNSFTFISTKHLI